MRAPAAFTSTMTLTLLQGLVTVVCLELMRRAGWVEYQPWSWDIMLKVRPRPTGTPPLSIFSAPLSSSSPSPPL